MLMTFEDKTILCCKCRLPFVFTVSEQGYFELRQLKNEPKRCSNCRILRRLEEQGKEIATCLTKVDCHECGDVTLVPFKPSGVKPVYCANCMHARKTETNSTP
jgi:CxxC-x17-CxxC domain-containing protein